MADEVDYDVEFIERSEEAAKFLVRGVTPAFANGIRRAMIADVPTMAIDTVRVIENTSVMFDEQIGLRLGLVPLTTPPGEFEEDDTVTLAMDVEGPATAYSGDLETSDDMVEPAEENVPIIDLNEGQRLQVEAEATLSSGKDHAKHQGGVAVGYRHLQRVSPGDELDEFADRDARIVRGVVEDDGELVPAEEFDHDLRNLYPDREVEIENVDNAFVFHVETDGSLSVDRLVREAVNSIETRATELEEAVAL